MTNYCCGDIGCFGLWKRVPSNLESLSVCLHHLIGSFTILLIGVEQHLSSFLSLYYKMNGMYITSFRTKIMYVYYKVIEIYLLVCTNIFSPFYFLCITNMPHHSPTMDFTHINYAKIIQNKNLNSFHNFIP